MDDELADLLDDVEEEFKAFGTICLYQFTWAQNIGERPDERDVILRLAREAYGEFRRRHPDAWLGWVTWPDTESGDARPAAPDTELDFTLDWKDPAGGELLALVID